MQQKQPKLKLQLQPPKSASKTSWRCLAFTDASECDEEVRKVLYSIRYLVSCSCAVPELVEKKARALLEAKQTEAVAQLAPDAPNSPPLQLPAVALRHQTPTKAAAAYGGVGASPGGKPKKKGESAPVIGGVYDWDGVKQYFLDEMRSKGCLVSTASGLESISNLYFLQCDCPALCH